MTGTTLVGSGFLLDAPGVKDWSAYIAEVRISPPVEAKLRSKHAVTAEEVREAVVLRTDVDISWNYHNDRGWRLYVIGRTHAGRCLWVVLYRLDDDGVWSLGTAIPRG
jgi:hypothetical protein